MSQHFDYKNSMISVITPTYNSEQFIAETIKSVQNQTYVDWEMVIVDDHSKDRTIDIIAEYQENDPRIKLYQLKTNKGAGHARNVAMDIAIGRYIAFLDSDDLWKNDKLEKQYHFMLNREIPFSYTPYTLIDETSNVVGSSYTVPDQLTHSDLLKFCHIGCLTVMLDRNKVGHVQMDLARNRQDYLLWLDITKEGHSVYALQESLSYYRKVSNSISSNKFKVAKLNWKIYRERFNMNMIKSTWYFSNYVFFYLKKIMQQRKQSRDLKA